VLEKLPLFRKEGALLVRVKTQVGVELLYRTTAGLEIGALAQGIADPFERILRLVFPRSTRWFRWYRRSTRPDQQDKKAGNDDNDGKITQASRSCFAWLRVHVEHSVSHS